jgi:hypothetical protein
VSIIYSLLTGVETSKLLEFCARFSKFVHKFQIFSNFVIGITNIRKIELFRWRLLFESDLLVPWICKSTMQKTWSDYPFFLLKRVLIISVLCRLLCEKGAYLDLLLFESNRRLISHLISTFFIRYLFQITHFASNGVDERAIHANGLSVELEGTMPVPSLSSLRQCRLASTVLQYSHSSLRLHN